MSRRSVVDTSRREFMVASVMGAGILAAAAAVAARDPSEKDESSSGTKESSSSGKVNRNPVPLAPPDQQSADAKMPEPVERKVGWAIVGLGKLALEEVMPAFGECKYSKPVALVSGHPDKAKQVAEVYGINTKNIYNYDNYDELAKNDQVDVIYIILPNSMHAEYTIRGLKAGKHVLCEKPMAATSKECEEMIAAAEQANRKLMIAYRLQYEPFNRKVIELCKEKKLGELKLFYGTNGQDVAAPNIRLSKKLGGGPLGDVGVYCINAARYTIGEQPSEVTAFSYAPKDDPRFREVPESVVFTMRFPSGVVAHCGCSFGTAESRQYRVVCEKGTIDMDQAFSYYGQELRVNDGQGPQNTQLKPVNHFTAEMDYFSFECVLGNKEPRTPGEEGLADMRIIEAIEEAARTGHAVKVRS